VTDQHVPADRAASAEELAATTRTQSFTAVAPSAAAARRFVLDALHSWGLSRHDDDAALCTAELATNAILHSRRGFTVAVRRTVDGARIDVQDDHPERLPVVVPSALGPLDTGITGRGLMMVAAIARRWGYFTTDIAKTVWAELTDEAVDAPSEPHVELASRTPASGGFLLRLLDMPVRLAIASGVQVDELVREVQLDPARLTVADRDLLHELLERSARSRLVGRQAAFKAAAEGLVAYSLQLPVTPDEVAAMALLSPLLASLATQGEIEAAAVGDEVLSMRSWINEEITAQAGGAAPTPYRSAD
jgi:hypothetical protein